jgi:mono/diheme cytochrome c family protein
MALRIWFGISMSAIAVLASIAQARAADLDAAALYRSNCAACHGVTGFGGGPVASSFSVLMPQLATLAQRNRGVFPQDYVLRIIDGREPMMAHGTRNMPVWGSIFDARHQGDGETTSTAFLIEAIVEYVKGLQIE